MSIPMAACWAMRMSSPRSISAAPIMKKPGWARPMWISSSVEVRRDGKAPRLLARQPALPHGAIGALDMLADAVGVEQGAAASVLGQPAAQGLQFLRMMGQAHRQGLETGLIFG